MESTRFARRRGLAAGAPMIVAVLAILGACGRMATTTTQAPACNAALCNISQATWQDHIDPRHCQGSCVGNHKSIFAGAYCGSRASAVTFCQTLMGRPGCAGTAQPNGRVSYTADLAGTAGEDRNNACANTARGTVIYDPIDDAVVTQFPGNP